MKEVRSATRIYQSEIKKAGKHTQSKIESGDKWKERNNPLRDFERDFRFVIPPGYSSMKDYIETKFAAKKGTVRGLELGGVGSRLFEDFSPGFFKETRGVSLSDYRGEYDKEDDPKIHHDVIEGDLLTNKTLTEVKEWLGKDQKVDVIIERMIGGHNCLPNEPFAMSKVVNSWYELLSDNGVLFAELPHAFRRDFHPKTDEEDKENFMKAWKDMIKRDYQGELRLIENGYYFFLEKLPGAPEKLPVLPARFVVEKERKRFNEGI